MKQTLLNDYSKYFRFQGQVMFSDSGDRIARTQIEQMQGRDIEKSF